jgi:hypothetical protein
MRKRKKRKKVTENGNKEKDEIAKQLVKYMQNEQKRGQKGA